MNSYLKEVFDVDGITKKLNFHRARHIYAITITLSNDAAIETVSKMLGHTNLKTTQHYAKLLILRIGSDVRALKQRLAKRN